MSWADGHMARNLTKQRQALCISLRKLALSSACSAEKLCRRAGEGGCQHTSFLIRTSNYLWTPSALDVMQIHGSKYFPKPSWNSPYLSTILEAAYLRLPFIWAHRQEASILKSLVASCCQTKQELWINGGQHPSGIQDFSVSHLFCLYDYCFFNNPLLSFFPSSGTQWTQLAWLCRWCCHSELWHLPEFLAEE